MIKVKVKDLPVFYAGKRYVKDKELEIDDIHVNEGLFEVLEVIEDDPFKGVKVNTLKKALEEAGIQIPENADREKLIELFIEKELTLEK